MGNAGEPRLDENRRGLRGFSAWFRLFGVRNLDILIFSLHIDINQTFTNVPHVQRLQWSRLPKFT